MIDILAHVELAKLKDDLVFINDSLANLEGLLMQLKLPSTSYRRQELESERSQLLVAHRVISTKIQELSAPDPSRVAAAERTAAMRQNAVERYRRAAMERAAEYDRLGDYRNGSRERLSAAFDARRNAEHEIHG